MKKIANQASRVHWHMGQALLPEHFYAQEQSLREEHAQRLRVTQRAPGWGLASLHWDDFQLQKGIVSVQDITLVLASGVLVDIPANTAPAFLNVNATGSTKAPVYLHLQSGYDIVKVGQGDLAEDGIDRIVQKVELSIKPYSQTSAEAFKLAELSCGPDGVWAIETGYVPPLLQVGDEPFLSPFFERMKIIARALRQTLLEEVRENHLAAEGQAAAKQCLRGLFAFQAFVADVESGIRPHAFDLYERLRDLSFDVCVFRGVEAAGLLRPYRHDELGPCLEALLDELEQQVHVGRQKLPYVEFERQNGLLSCPLGKEVRRAKDVFLLVQKPQVGAKLDLSRIKLASSSRLSSVHERALRGIPFSRLDSPPFHHGLASTVEFYGIQPGQEWDYAVAEGKVVLFEAPQLQNCRLYLYWREE